MTSRTKTILFALTAILLFSFMAQQHGLLFSCKPLNGVTEEKKMPAFSFDNYRDGSLQKGTEAYLKQHYGFNEPLTRLYNQCLWTFFRYSWSEEKMRILVTDDNWIFEPWTVEEYYQGCGLKFSDDLEQLAKAFDAEAKRLYQIQHVLEPYGTHLFVALLPGKELVCGEHMPPNTRYHKEKKLTAFSYYSKRLKELGVNHTNIGEWFVQMKDTVSYPLYPQTGTHWSNLAAIHVADSLIRYMEHLADTNLINLLIGTSYPRTLHPDDDLESLMNLIWPLKKAPNYYASAYCDYDTTALRPRLLTIGDSYYWNILNSTPVWDVFDGVPYWFYFSTAFFNGDETKVADKDLMAELLSADFVMISYGTTQLYSMSNGFATKALLEFCYEKEEIEYGMAQARNDFESDTAMVAKAKKRAKKENDPLAVAMDDEFEDWMKLHIETYFPALRDSIPTKRSLRARALAGDSIAFLTWETLKTIERIKERPELLESIRQKALERGFDLETMIQYDAQWIVDEKIKTGILKFEGKPKKRVKTENYGIQQ